MEEKYKISKVDDYDLWEKFENESPQSSIYSSVESIKLFKKNLNLYSISKGAQIKSLIYLYVDKKIILSEPLIYSGLLFQPQRQQKNCRYIAEKFRLTEIFIDHILKEYKNLEINLHYNIKDVRAFQWFNYHELNKPKFKTEIRYTSLINLKNKLLEDIFKNLDDVKQRDIKKCLKRTDLIINYDLDLESFKKNYINTMKKNNSDFFDKNLNTMMIFLEKIHLSGKAFQTNLIYKNKIIYSNLFSLHNNTACYLYGAGDVDVSERLGGTYSLWKAIEKCYEKKIECVDLEGVNSPQRGSFKISFGGNLANYYKVILNKEQL